MFYSDHRSSWNRGRVVKVKVKVSRTTICKNEYNNNSNNKKENTAGYFGAASIKLLPNVYIFNVTISQAFRSAGDRVGGLSASGQPAVGRLRRRRGLPVTWSLPTNRVRRRRRRSLDVDVDDVGRQQIASALLRRRPRRIRRPIQIQLINRLKRI